MKRLVICVFLASVVGCGNQAIEDSEPAEPKEVESKPATPDTGIRTAVVENKPELVKQHIDAGTDLDQRSPIDQEQNSALMLAAVFGRTGIAKGLIAAGAKLDLVDVRGATALHKAAFLCHEDIVKLLLEKGADPSIKNNEGHTALDGVEGSFEEVKGIYDILDSLVFNPVGEPLDYERLAKMRPKIAEILKGSGEVRAEP